MSYKLDAIGEIHNNGDDVRIEIYPRYGDGLLGIEQFSHILVFYWLHENDTSEIRETLRVHPCGNESNPLTGVFATHSPRRPNLIALTRCRLLEVAGCNLTIEKIDAFHGSPVIDIKAFFPNDDPPSDCRFPDWKKKTDQ